MNNKLSTISRVVFIVAVLTAGLAIFERVSYAMGYTLLRGTLCGGRLLGFRDTRYFRDRTAAAEIRDVLRTKR